MDIDSTVSFLERQTCLWVVIELPARDDVDVVPGFCQVERELGQNLARRRMIGEEISRKKRRFIGRHGMIFDAD